MKRINLENVLWSLHTMTEEVKVDLATARAGAGRSAADDRFFQETRLG